MWGQQHAVHTEERRGPLNIVAGKPEGKRQLAKPRRRWEDNIKMGIQEIRWRRRRFD